MTVKVTRIESESQWLVLEGSLDGFPQCTERRSISASALASGALVLADEVAALRTRVQSNYDGWVAVQEAIDEGF